MSGGMGIENAAKSSRSRAATCSGDSGAAEADRGPTAGQPGSAELFGGSVSAAELV